MAVDTAPGRGPRRPWRARCAAGALAAAALAGCGVSETGPTEAGPPASVGPGAESSEVTRLYFAHRQGVWPATRPHGGESDPQSALDALLAGPNAAERARGLTTRVPADGQRAVAERGDGAVELRLPWAIAELDSVAVSQLVCTAAAAPGGRAQGVVVRVHEHGGPTPWEVVCAEDGTVTPRAADGALP
ncbi:hypothetical protein SAMN06297387_10525 [Streptomyces zhaozhouensis]|uniref:Sporulation and spore germination n=1 Tax=Streptomyces zhaozhouensis TaxID=1300267 RepID=A0A286DU93_9ACTN|nr:hypothetical protein [Streptomyces zhaozhouensis]SOD62210.1 hypothetical protein SAMN06297387_10525 [Streptomyces zhaozhouensis]